MRVLVLAPHPFFQSRGTPIAVKALVDALSAAHHKVDVLTFHEGEDVRIPDGRVIRIRNVPLIHGVRPGFSIKKVICDVFLYLRARKLLKQESYDLIHAVEESAFLALLLKREFRIPYLYDMDSSLAQQMIERFAWLSPLRRLLERFEAELVRGSSAVIAVCRSLEDTARGYDAEKPMLRLEDFTLLRDEVSLPPREQMAISSSRPRAMYVGNLEPYQGIDLLLDAFVRAKKTVPQASLVIIGGAEADRIQYQKRAKELGIGDATHFEGPKPVEHLGAYLEQADVLLSPRTKGFNTPMKVYSYLDSGRALLATRLPTHTQVLDDEISCLADPEPGAFGDALAHLLSHPEEAERIGNAARARVEREFTREAYARKLAAFYTELQPLL